VKKVVLGFSLGLALACAPELRSGEGERCDEASPCADSLQCYRGFCIPGDEGAEPAPIVTHDDDGASSQDAGEARSNERDGGGAPSSGSLPSSISPTATDASVARANDAQASPGKPSANPTVTATPATMSDAAARPTPDAGPGKPPTTVPPSTADAGVSLDAAVAVNPDAALPQLPKDCTLEDCCAEAAGGKGESKGGKRCGCEDPALLRTLTCTVGGVVGGVVGGLL
jgi:hypothetical protein